MGLRPAPRQVRKQRSSSRIRVQAAPRTGTSADTCSLGPPRPSLARLPPLRLGRGPALLSSHAGPRGLGEESGALEALRLAFPRQLCSAHPMRVTVNQRQASGPRAQNGGCTEGPGSGRPRNRAAAVLGTGWHRSRRSAGRSEMVPRPSRPGSFLSSLS